MRDVILIEDDNDLREFLRDGLANTGYTVREADGGTDGLTQFMARPAEIVITDMVMAEGEGMETLMALRDARPAPKVLVISGNPLYVEQSLLLGANGALLKPFTLTAMLDTLAAL